MSAPLPGSFDTELSSTSIQPPYPEGQIDTPASPGRRPAPPIPRSSVRRRPSRGVSSSENTFDITRAGINAEELHRLSRRFSLSSNDEVVDDSNNSSGEKNEATRPSLHTRLDSEAPTLMGVEVDDTTPPPPVPNRHASHFFTKTDLESGLAAHAKEVIDNDPRDSEETPSTPEAGKEHNHEHPRPKLPIRARLKHFTWAWYTLCMSTGGLSLLIAAQPHKFKGLMGIGLAVYIVNIIFFVLVTSLMITRFLLFPGTFKGSVTHTREGFFVPTFFLSIATLITSTQKYCVGDDVLDGEKMGLRWAIQIAFWIYVALATTLAVVQYSYIFSRHSFGLHTMMPTWILPIFPVMLSGTIASVIAGTQPDDMAVPIITSGLSCQGLGLSVAVMMYAHMVGRLMQSGLPDREHRPGLFMCVGPPSFTALAFIGMARGLPETFDSDMDGLFLDTAMMVNMAIVGAGFLWALSFWWFCIAVLAIVQSPPQYFHLGWWAAVFPNTGFILATISLGKSFQNESVLWFGTAMSIMLLITYLFVLGNHARAVVVQDIVYPGRDEDVNDH
ncbi:putative malic acid transport protein [Podospora australis]|uniref:Malic acid transport protein n=1 Tax=Podospora australis TaxID=1536484 RepID=A0AAN7AJ73_9PEZI|nr:putative malic acid transport protein [Podospora australis]